VTDVDDKRFVPEFSDNFHSVRRSIEKWSYCKYCYKKTPQFILKQKALPKSGFSGTVDLRCCWECGSGLEVVKDTIKRVTS
jgi:hypothetical protein